MFNTQKKKDIQPITYIHQILINNDGDAVEPNLPGPLAYNAREAQRLHSKAKYIIWTNSMLDNFLKENFPEEVVKAYRTLAPFAYKADLARYCLLYKLGGLYVDLGICMMNPWEIPKDKGFATFKELNFSSDSWTTMQNGLIWSLPGRRELELMIESIIKHCQEKYYGKTPLYPTGPILFGRLVAQAMLEGKDDIEIDDQWIGEYRWTTPEEPVKNDAYVSPDGRLVAYRTKNKPGDLSHLGLKNTNNYKDIWQSRQIYGEEMQTFLPDDERLHLRQRGKRSKHVLKFYPGPEEVVMFGPYISLAKGNYKLTIRLAQLNHNGKLHLKITAGAACEEIMQHRFSLPSMLESKTLTTIFALSEDRDLVEFVFKPSSELSVEIAHLTLTPTLELPETPPTSSLAALRNFFKSIKNFF